MLLPLILTNPIIATPPEGYSVIKIVKATAPLPSNISGPMDNPALKAIIRSAKAVKADALLNFVCQTNGREIGCQGIAIKHNFRKPKTNIFNHTANILFGDTFYQNPAKFPHNTKVGKPISVIFYFPPTEYRLVSGKTTTQTKALWGLKKSTKTVIKPMVPALCIDALHFLHHLKNSAHSTGMVNFNCYPSLSSLPGYIQVNAAANTVRLKKKLER